MTNHITIEEYRRLVAGGKVPTPATSRPRCPGCERQIALMTLVQKLLAVGHEVRLEHRFHSTRRWRFDVALLGSRVALEIDGGGWVHGRHHREQGRQADEEKRQAAESLGWRVLRVSWDHVKSGEALALIERVVERETEEDA
jgi:very-short-patch-repair endonuclease